MSSTADVENAESGCSEATTAIPVSRRVVFSAAIPVVLLAVYVTLLQVPKTALELPFRDSENVQVLNHLAPQGWAFFTKSPRGESIRLFERTPAGVSDASSYPLSDPQNWFGLDRLPRAQGTEYGTLLASQPDDHWTDCTDFDACTDPSIPSHPVDNPVPSPTYCGDVYAIGYGTTPWAWRHFGYDPRQPERTVRMSVTC